ncbi:MAG: zinc metalloprotease HtpX [Rhodothermaceae bacterium]
MNTIKTTMLMTAMMVLFILVGGALGGESGMMIAFAISLAMNFGSYWFSDKIVLAMYRAQPVTKEQAPELYTIVENLAMRAEMPMPKLYIVENDNPNAFATGRNPENGAVAVTTGILRILNKEELEGVIAHELSHIKHRDILVSTIAATLVGTITFLSRIATWAAMFGGRDEDEGSGIGDLVLIIIAPIAAVLIQLAISRSREYLADEGGAKITGNANGLASALNKLAAAGEKIPMKNAGTSSAHMFIVNPLSGKALMKLFSTHPPMEERIKRLNEISAGRR